MRDTMKKWVDRYVALLIVVVPMALGLLIFLPAALSTTAQAAGPDEISLRRDEVRALERIAAQLDKINDTLKECRR